MRLVTWNCCRGAFENRFGEIESLNPDITVIQECSPPKRRSPSLRWSRVSNATGIAVRVADGFSISRLGADRPLHRSVHGYHICGPTSFNLLAVWSHPSTGGDDYRSPWVEGIKAYESHLKGSPLVIVGDLNDNPLWDKDYRDQDVFKSFLDKVCKQYNLVSAYHKFHGEEHGRESQFTHFNNRIGKEYHIDHVLLPKVWRISQVIISSRIFDHMPVVVDVRTSLADRMKLAGLSPSSRVAK